jgi:hypothetical protein
MNSKDVHLVIISFLAYILVNLVENIIHYNIGRHSNNNQTNFEIPNTQDLIKIIVVMFISALMQGFLTYFFEKNI